MILWIEPGGGGGCDGGSSGVLMCAYGLNTYRPDETDFIKGRYLDRHHTSVDDNISIRVQKTVRTKWKMKWEEGWS